MKRSRGGTVRTFTQEGRRGQIEDLEQRLEHQRRIAGDNADYWNAERERVLALETDRDALRDALETIVSHETDPCRIDPHGGYCSTHSLSKPCMIAAARALLPPEEQPSD